MRQKYMFFLLFICMLSCRGFHDKDIPEENHKNDALILIDNFQEVDSSFFKYFPDTSMNFGNADELFSFARQQQKLFRDVTTLFAEKYQNSDSAILLVNNATIEFSRRLDLILINQLYTFPLDIDNMFNLSVFHGLPDGASVRKRMDLYNRFPKNIRNSKVGKKTWNEISLRLLDKNTVKKLGEFPETDLVSVSGETHFLSEIISSQQKFYILIFGASWCRQCILDEKQLKVWFPLIDTSSIKVVGLSIDNKRENWLKYLAKENFPWENYLLPNDWNNQLTKKLNINSLPMSFLIDQSGTILVQSNNIRDILKYLSAL